MSNNKFEKATGAVDWTWKPSVTFNSRWQKVTHVAVEIIGKRCSVSKCFRVPR